MRPEREAGCVAGGQRAGRGRVVAGWQGKAHLLLLPTLEEVGHKRHGHCALAACRLVELVVGQHVGGAVAQLTVLLAPLRVGCSAVLLGETELHPLGEFA